MIVLAFDTATADTAVGLLDSSTADATADLLAPRVVVRTARHAAAAGERPGHSSQLLALARGLLAEARLDWSDVERIAVGTGPGGFTGLRIGVATARALAQAGGQELVGVSTLEALARGAVARNGTMRTASRHAASVGAVLACVDARRGEAYVAAWRDGLPLLGPPRAVAPEGLAALLALDPGPWSAVGDGSLRFRAQLEAAGAHVPPDGSPLHHVDGARLCVLALEASPADRDTLEPEYVRAPDAVPTHLR